jgi:Protein of unknown function (DUF2934)
MRPRLQKLPRETRPEVEEPKPSPEELQRMIAEAAYYRAEKRGFTPGLEAEDWCAAEAEILSRARI